MNSGQFLLVVFCCAIDLLVLLRVLYAGDSAIGVSRLAQALGAATGAAALKLPVALSLVPSLFFAVSLGYADLVVVAPLAALVTLSRQRARPLTSPVKALAWLALLVAPSVGVYASFIEPFRLVEERVRVQLNPRHAPADPLRVAVLADMQSRAVDEHLREAVRRAMAFEPHLVLLPGDLIQEEADAYDRVTPDFRALLAELHAPLGVYFVIGNTDDPSRIRGVLQGTDVRLLEDEVAEVEFAGKRVLIGGAGFRLGAPRTQAFRTAFDRRDGDELRILVAHYPDAALGLGEARGIDLIVAGHTHGGQVQVPGFGAPLTLSSVPRRVGSGGLHELDGRQVYVSRGVGCERGAAPRIRFFCPPEVTLLTLGP